MMRRSRNFFGLPMMTTLLSLLLVGDVHARSDFYESYEIRERTHEAIRAILDAVKFPCLQIYQGYHNGMLTMSGAPTHENNTRNLLYTQIKIVPPSVAMLYIASEQDGMFMGYFSEVPMSGYNEYIFQPNNLGVVTQYFTNKQGAPVSPTTSFAYNPKGRPWYKAAQNSANISSWTVVYPFFNVDARLGITFTTQLYDADETFVGVAAVDVELKALDVFLGQVVKNDPHDIVMYVMDQSGYLVASSETNGSVALINGYPTQILARNSSNNLIRSSAQFLQTVTAGSEGGLLLHDHMYIQQSIYVDSHAGLEWTVVLMYPSFREQDNFEYNSSAFYALGTVSIILSLITLSLMAWVIYYRTMQIWKASQIGLTLLILCANLMCVVSTFVLAGPLSLGMCILRQWWITIAATITCVAYVTKIFRVYWAFLHAKNLQIKYITTHQAATAMFALVGIQITFLVIWTGIDPMSPRTSFVRTTNQLLEISTCASHHAWGFALVASLIGALGVFGGVLAYKCRNMSELFAEGKALMIIYYHGAIIVILIAAFTYVGGTSNAESYILISVGMCWFTITSQGMFFLPRVLRQVGKGDLTLTEIKQIARADFKSIDQSAHWTDEQ